MSLKNNYGYIVDGAGSAGCALANRLSKGPATNVSHIESGPSESNPFIRMPRGISVVLNEGSKFVWSYQAKPAEGRAAERWSKGKFTGGSNSVNGTVYVRCAPLDYDSLEAMRHEGRGRQNIEKIHRDRGL